METDQKQTTRKKILSTAAAKLRSDGIKSASVEKIMKACGLTVGGFYAHFKSKEALILESLDSMIAQIDGYFATLTDKNISERKSLFVSKYLSPEHRNATDKGCPIASLSTDIGRENIELRMEFTKKIEALLEKRTEQLFGSKKEADLNKMIALYSTMIGALVLSRATKGSPASEKILSVVKAELLKESK